MQIFIVTSRVDQELDPPAVFSKYDEASSFVKTEYTYIYEAVLEEEIVKEKTFFCQFHARVENSDETYEWFITPVKVQEVLFTTVDTGEYHFDKEVYFNTINKISNKAVSIIQNLWRNLK